MKAKGLTKLLSILALLFLSVGTALALPSGQQVVNGNASFNTQGNSLTITNTPNTIINWQNFSIFSNESVLFSQQSSASSILNRIIGQNPSYILGLLQSNGKVFLINPNGVFFGQGSQVNVNGLIVSTLGLSNKDFLAGNYNFTAGSTAGPIKNQGTISTPSGGAVYLIAPDIENSGIITSPNGNILLAAGHSVQLVDSSNPDISVVVSADGDKAVNLGQIIAQSGKIGIYGGLITQSGIVSADSAVVGGNGQILLKATNDINLAAGSTTSAKGGGTIQVLGGMESGTVTVNGTLDASAPNGGNGGSIETSASQVSIGDNAHITTLAPFGKAGQWLIDPEDYDIGATEATNIDAALANTNVTITTTPTTASCTNVSCTGNVGGGLGDINVNSPLGWSANTTLTLSAYNNINVNANITATGNTAGLNLFYGGSSSITAPTGGTGYFLNNGASITLSGSTPSLYIANHSYTVINSLGSMGDTSGTTLQGINGNSAVLSGHYALGSNIDASGSSNWGISGFTPIGASSPSFSGTFDGLGHTISNLYINLPSNSYVGLFGANTGTIRNVGLVGVNVTGSGFVGGLVGENENSSASISNSYATGNVTGSGLYVGGLAGGNYNSASINNSYANCTVISSNWNVGGLVGWNQDSALISNSYATGNVTGTSVVGSYVGGLVGGNGASISN
ncbi:MAG: filamentous hemagglutinin N-terminal domain-containing protein, partial [Dissulfurispiraceae bacterium]